MSNLPDLARGVVVHVHKVPDSDRLECSVYIEGGLILRSKQEKSEIGPVLLSGLAQGLAEYGQSDELVRGALVWEQSQALALPPAVAKQDVDQSASWLGLAWRWLRVFLASSRF